MCPHICILRMCDTIVFVGLRWHIRILTTKSRPSLLSFWNEWRKEKNRVANRNEKIAHFYKLKYIHLHVRTSAKANVCRDHSVSLTKRNLFRLPAFDKLLRSFVLYEVRLRRFSSSLQMFAAPSKMPVCVCACACEQESHRRWHDVSAQRCVSSGEYESIWNR